MASNTDKRRYDWKSCGRDDGQTDDVLYIIDEQDASERISLGSDSWLLIRDDDGLVKFAVFEFHSGPATQNHVAVGPMKHSILFSGSGPSGVLRECRHIWWGDDRGYTCYADFALIEAALRELRRWFDGY